MMKHNSILNLDTDERMDVGTYLLEQINDYLTYIRGVRVSPELSVDAVAEHARRLSFEHPVSAREAINHILEGLKQYQVHTPHPRYFGLFNPRPNFMGIMADTITAAFNPQLAAWSHAPIAVEMENYVLKEIASKFGYLAEAADGTFTTGGAEVNLTAVLTALVHRFPSYAKEGLRSLPTHPVMYASAESHHSLVKAARTCGLGTDSLRMIKTDSEMQLDVHALHHQIQVDRAAGYTPFLIFATGGTTGTGAIDPINEMANLAEREQLWLHVDAAYGGAAVFIPELRDLLRGIERADSITFDAHKWMSVPIGAGIYITRHKHILHKTFSITADYMPKEGADLDVIDPFTHSIQWSRRFIGLKVYLSLVTVGWEGYRSILQHQTEMGNRLRRELACSNWKVINDTALPVVCFTDSNTQSTFKSNFASFICQEILRSGLAWISVYEINKVPVLRACITNYDTTEEDIMVLMQLLNEARTKYLEEISERSEQNL
ncbi:pyridoxal phosphate-dependent decarboxylase family protein [Brevibacillus invocatus]|uniref:pyridoxal phosphate-dependent decarboxylase family protein n=1 Tax=Brevibacillus invocatus TaxID=173959 RepID=UPI00203A9FC0|nr:aminotransferase class V-fold PLP-dependent enzyme [Brevibacillus invocatus]MCM3431233.1 aminotransferase class V-fold PLP-dependent enzyme [Brevibacillus invocatus]